MPLNNVYYRVKHTSKGDIRLAFDKKTNEVVEHKKLEKKAKSKEKLGSK